ncbi:CHAP domain-containing protein [uncultured Nocardioides sp.]|uniref:CHAP domain-containing protein n=1 Tax=uncultured Nocardioides sp. TaxID=198441 RepID=UPI0026370FEF|nr:CHAP domain-containing protein [uncultured Nocardioides sp.]
MTRIRGLIGVSLAAFLVAVGVPFAPPAAAEQVALCDGYAGCADKGYGNRGYRANNDRMWWRMYTGHNCTNYVAYRMVQSGMSTERPWDGSGNASNWGHAMSRITDDTPMVGSVAWWDSHQGYAGSNGHVAYVEKVVSKREIIVSEDFWGGDFHWRRITKGDRYWPNGFIHFNDREVEATEQPTITGDAAVGETLRATTGSWTPSASQQLQWYAAGKPIPGATEATFTPTPAQRKTRLSVVVTARSKGYVDGTASTPRSRKVQPGTLVAAAAPALEGTARVAETLTTSRGSFEPAADSTTVQWFADGEPIEGATGNRLKLTPGLMDARITSQVTAVREGYHDLVVTSPATERVAPGRIVLDEPWKLRGEPARGERLTVDPGTVVTPEDAEVTYTWLRDGKPVDGRDGLHYRLGTSDVGRLVAVRVEVSRRGYATQTQVLEAAHRTTTTSRTTAEARVKVVDKGTRRKPDVRRHVVLDLLVEARGVDGPAGPVVVKVDGREVEARVEQGTGKVKLRNVEPGKHRIRVVYLGTEVIGRSRDVLKVRVPKDAPAEESGKE